MTDEPVLEIEQGRHPVLEQSLPASAFVPNDTHLGGTAGTLLLLTGPNMAGKSTYIRQVALLAILAQMGSFIPARSARMGIVDRIFSRIGAGDDLFRGQSTFMVEMAETANLLHHATSRSLVILDEVGRGTSTYDGLALAWAIVEHLHDQNGCRTLFATHYHELTQLAQTLPGVRNYNVAVHDDGRTITFLYRVVPGAASRSYGIHVAQLAGVPLSVVHRAEQVLRQLEEQYALAALATESARRQRRRQQPRQPLLFGSSD
jgi:DNA mismatch repair protein MutS